MTSRPTSERRPRPAAKSATPWGPATVVEELRIPQRAGEKRFAALFQLLEAAHGEQLVRISYSTGGASRRGPVTLRGRDVAKLRESLAGRPRLAAALGLGLREGEA